MCCGDCVSNRRIFWAGNVDGVIFQLLETGGPLPGTCESPARLPDAALHQLQTPPGWIAPTLSNVRAAATNLTTPMIGYF